jgi:hypothetical protein
VRMGIVIGKSGSIVAENWNRKTFTDIYNFRLLGKHTITIWIIWIGIIYHYHNNLNHNTKASNDSVAMYKRWYFLTLSMY